MTFASDGQPRSWVNGQWLQIADEGGYTLRDEKRASGWIRKAEVVALQDDDTISSYTEAIRDSGRSNGPARQRALLLWLRGICMESKTPERGAEPDAAIADFDGATEIYPPLADAWLRQGRLVALKDVKESRAKWERCFINAYEGFVLVYAANRSARPTSGGYDRQSPKSSAASKPNYGSQSVPAPADAAAGPVICSKFIPPRLYLELGRAYQRLSDAYWRRDKAKEVAQKWDKAAATAKKADGVRTTAAELDSVRHPDWPASRNSHRGPFGL